MLQSLRRKKHFDRTKCEENQDEDLERALQFLEAKDDIDPKDVALIKFEPSLIDPDSEYGDELYIPSNDMYSHLLNKEDDSLVGVVKPSQQMNSSKIKRKKVADFPEEKIKLSPQNIKLNRRLTDDEFYQLLDMISFATEDDEFPEIIDYPSSSTELENSGERSSWSYTKRKGKYDDLTAASTGSDINENSDDSNGDLEDLYFVTDTPKVDSTFVFDRAHRYDVKKPGPFFKVNNYMFEKDSEQEPEQTHVFQYHPMFEESDMSLGTFRHLHHNNPTVELTAEGMDHDAVDTKGESNFVPETLKRFGSPSENDNAEDSIYAYPSAPQHFPMYDNGLSESLLDTVNRDEEDNQFLEEILPKISSRKTYGNAKSRRKSSARQDSSHKHSNVKYSQHPGGDKAAVIVDKFVLPPESNDGNTAKSDVSDTEKRIFTPNNYQAKLPLVAPTASVEVDPTSENDFEIVDASYAYIDVDKQFTNLNEGIDFVRKLETLLQLPLGTFSSIRQKANQIKFKVNTNPYGMTASDVVRKAESLKDELHKITDKSLKSAGIGNKVHLTVHELNNGSQVIIITFIVCGVIAGLVLGVGVLYLILHHSRSKQKLQNITQADSEASQDYQELCRQRMAIKSTEKPEPIQVLTAQRIGGLSRESETSVHSPSSRSSTSSWNEEPLVLNMDISTGHMVLSYMEDHLTNKDRLDKEWEALCKYDADQSTLNVAKQDNNSKKNRNPNLLPYDHSRVILNEFCNSAGSDYINANTITDHDPRNAAYIATQGPLPHTSADFWQMIWEQGSVVIVMLTRLVENGVAMCHRYWPEEGSELYHIYEVHLVSEHIWCEDYLIRSFYLKNLKTGETRTVTQFHFLSWPDVGVPVSAKMILDFRRKVNKSYRGRSCPIVVHCSDGCGRSGTYCLIDMVLNRIAKGLKEIDIAATLEHIRDQRAGMVQTKDQFQFVLMAVAEEVHSILKAIP
ncbi:hypothetical protein CHUAL_003064 [Chamberlinius hualienensis]